jgi:23S rRNA pseudouridine1911/1915/1917 synthase
VEILTAPPEAAGERLDRFLAPVVGSRARAQRLIDAGLVRVDGLQRAKRHLLAGGERVEVDEDDVVRIDDAGGDAEAAPHSVVFEDDHLIIVDKPAGVVVHPARGHRTRTLVQALGGRSAGGEDPWRPGIVHRLDRDTSGLLVVAKSEAVHRDLKRLLASRAITREYLALVEGRPPSRTGTIEAPIGRDPRDPTRMATGGNAPRGARTHFEIELALSRTTLLRVRLDTGRTHQIRVHLQAIGHPVVGDPVYGTGERLGLERQFLHAARLAFPHPVTGEAIDAASPLPADLAAALELAAAPAA